MASTSSQTGSFAGAIRNAARKYPTNEYGIIMDDTTGTLTDDCIYALESYTNIEKLDSYSKLSNGRIMVFFTDKITAETLTKSHKYITVNNKQINIRPIISPHKRLVISNPPPTIPHEIIINKLKELGIKPTSEMIFLRAGLKKPGFAHIKSFRRSIYVSDDIEHIPETTVIEFENRAYRIFISDDSEYCVYCKKHGHKIELCKYKMQDEQNNKQQPTPQTTPQANQVNQTTTRSLTNEIQTESTNTTAVQLTNRYEILLNTSETTTEETTISEENTQNEAETNTQTETPEQSTTQEQQYSEQQQQQQPNEIIISTQENSDDEEEQIKEYQEQQTLQNPNITKQKQNTTNKVSHQKSDDDITKADYKQDKPITSQKRTLSNAGSTDSLDENQSELNLTENDQSQRPSTSKEYETNKIKKPAKSRRTRSLSPGTLTEEWVNQLKEYFDQNHCNINLYQFQNFIELSQNSNDLLSLSRNYTNNPEELLNLMEKLRTATTNRSGKNRLTRTINKLQHLIKKR